MLELGFFVGELGRDRVAVLYEDGVELPSDLQGVAWVQLDDHGWKLKLGKEFRAAAIDCDLNRAT